MGTTRRNCATVLALAVSGIACGAAAAQNTVLLPQINVTWSRLGAGITGASTTTISAEEIERSPGRTLQDILSREPGVQVQTLFGGVNGVNSTVDMRGFGAAAVSNTLILVNGRRLNDIDLAGVDLSAIPRNSIERIEITRGNSGAVLYGDGAVGGVINIVTKTAAGQPPSARIEGAFSAYNYREGRGSANASYGPYSVAAYGNSIDTDGYRDNNELVQRSGVGELRYTGDTGSAYLNVSADDQHIGLPGGRLVDLTGGINQLLTDRRGAATPLDYADKQGVNATGGFTWMLAPGAELVVDGGVRRKYQQAGFFVITFPAADRYVDTTLTTLSLTPRVNVDRNILGMPSKTIAGVDFYDSEYNSERSVHRGDAPNHVYDLRQKVAAGYAQGTLTVLPGTDLSAGIRVQRTSLSARDTFDAGAPGFFPEPQGAPLDTAETQRAYHFGVEQRLTNYVTVFGRHARSFRVPNVDERVASVPTGVGQPTNFDLKTQTSHDWEGGVRLNAGPLSVQSSVYDMRLQNEVHFSPATFTNTNLDPTRRTGVESSATLRLNDAVRLKGGVARTSARFRDGIFAGNEVPLVSRWTGNAGLSWDIWEKWLTFDGVVRYVGSRRMDNDQVNLQPMIPGHTVVDVRIGGEADRFEWSVAVQNLFDADYFDYAIASPFPFGFGSKIGRYNAYPLPGRTVMARLGFKLP